MAQNFFRNIYESLNRNQEQELIIWPAGEKGDTSITYTGKESWIQRIKSMVVV